MKVSITFKNSNSSDDLKLYIQKKLDRFDKLFDQPVEANVVLSMEKNAILRKSIWRLTG